MSPFSFHVPATHYRRRPSVRFASAIAGNPFTRATVARLLGWACVIAGAFVAGQLVTLHAVGVL
jgi:hypothetical protein